MVSGRPITQPVVMQNTVGAAGLEDDKLLELVWLAAVHYMVAVVVPVVDGAIQQSLVA